MKKQSSISWVAKCTLAFTVATLLLFPGLFAVESQIVVPHPISFCESSSASSSPFPGSAYEWINSTPEEQMMNSTRLTGIMDYILDDRLAIDSLLVIRNGYLVMEEYPTGDYDASSLHNLYSVTKTVVSALVGIAIHEGFIESVDQKMVDLFSNYTIKNLDSQKEQITLEHLLTMTPGLEWDQWTYPTSDPRDSIYQMINSPNWVQFILDLPMVAEPGMKWEYSSGASHLLSAIIQLTTGMSSMEFANKYLFEPLDIHNVTWEYDPQGVYHGGGTMFMTPRNMAKIGYLFLNNGKWNGTHIFSEDWASKSSAEFINLGTYDPSLSHAGYGYQIWNVPSIGVYYATGLYGQKIYIFPEYDLVVVFTASMYYDVNPVDVILTDYIIPSILADCSQSEFSLHVFYSTYILVLTSTLLIFTAYWFIKSKLRL